MSQTALAPRPASEIPRTLIEEVELFKAAIVQVEHALQDGHLRTGAAQEQVNSACDSLARALREHVHREPDEERAMGAYVFRETFQYFARSSFVARAYAKPRGYPGDFATIDMLYQESAEGDGYIGPLIDHWVRALPAARAVRNRRALLADAIAALARSWRCAEPMPVTSLASGPARELFDVVTCPDSDNILATCIDIDDLAVAHASGVARQLGMEHHFVFVRDNIVRIVQGRGRSTLGPQALIYSVGFDGLPRRRDSAAAHQLGL